MKHIKFNILKKLLNQDLIRTVYKMNFTKSQLLNEYFAQVI